MKRLGQRTSGFTIVELLIVIVVIAILAAITIVAYNGMQKRAANSAIVSDFTAWKRAFSLYKAQYGNYPSMSPGGHYCLGTNFPAGKCRDYEMNNENTYTEADSISLMNELKKVTQVSSSRKYPINGTVGAYVTYGPANSGYIGMTMVLYGGGGDCPNQTTYVWDDGAGRLLCEYAFPVDN